MRDSFQFDEIGRWSELKLEIVEKYGTAYTTAFAGDRGKALKNTISTHSGCWGSPFERNGTANRRQPCACSKVRPTFDHFYFIDLNPEKTAYLKHLCEGRKDVEIITDDATVYLIQKLLQQ